MTAAQRLARNASHVVVEWVHLSRWCLGTARTSSRCTTSRPTGPPTSGSSAAERRLVTDPRAHRRLRLRARPRPARRRRHRRPERHRPPVRHDRRARRGRRALRRRDGLRPQPARRSSGGPGNVWRAGLPPLTVAGRNAGRSPRWPGVRVLGEVESVAPLLDRAALVAVPLHHGGGYPAQGAGGVRGWPPCAVDEQGRRGARRRGRVRDGGRPGGVRRCRPRAARRPAAPPRARRGGPDGRRTPRSGPLGRDVRAGRPHLAEARRDHRDPADVQRAARRCATTLPRFLALRGIERGRRRGRRVDATTREAVLAAFDDPRLRSSGTTRTGARPPRATPVSRPRPPSGWCSSRTTAASPTTTPRRCCASPTETGADVVGAPWLNVPEERYAAEVARRRAAPARAFGLDTHPGTFPPYTVETPFLCALALVRTEVARAVRYDDTLRGNAWREETDFYLRAVEAGYRVVCTPETASWQAGHWSRRPAPDGCCRTSSGCCATTGRFLRRHAAYLRAHGGVPSIGRAQARLAQPSRHDPGPTCRRRRQAPPARLGSPTWTSAPCSACCAGAGAPSRSACSRGCSAPGSSQRGPSRCTTRRRGCSSTSRARAPSPSRCRACSSPCSCSSRTRRSPRRAAPPTRWASGSAVRRARSRAGCAATPRAETLLIDVTAADRDPDRARRLADAAAEVLIANIADAREGEGDPGHRAGHRPGRRLGVAGLAAAARQLRARRRSRADRRRAAGARARHARPLGEDAGAGDGVVPRAAARGDAAEQGVPRQAGAGRRAEPGERVVPDAADGGPLREPGRPAGDDPRHLVGVRRGQDDDRRSTSPPRSPSPANASSSSTPTCAAPGSPSCSGWSRRRAHRRHHAQGGARRRAPELARRRRADLRRAAAEPVRDARLRGDGRPSSNGSATWPTS